MITPLARGPTSAARDGTIVAPSMNLLLAGLALVSTLQADRGEMRGVWVVRTAIASPESVDAVVDDAARAGLNALFVQVRGRGDALYRSGLAPRSEVLRGQPADFDPLARVLSRARARGLQVHAWINVLLAGGFGVPLPEGHVALLHPDWLMVPRSAATRALETPPAGLVALIEARRDPDAEGLYLSPFAPGAVTHLDGVVRELLGAYAVDGLHLDFIRYPAQDYDYSRAALTAFYSRHGRGWPLAGPEADPAGWASDRAAAVDALVERLARSARATRPSIVVSAAVVPEPVAMRDKGQAWPGWIRRGLIDAACVMAYTPDTGLFRGQILALRERLGPQARLWAGIGAYRLQQASVVEKVLAARAAGASGIVLFSSDSLVTANLDRLRDEAFGPAPLTTGSAPGAGSRRR
jgi:uncharacterized lipoprotein YddW (UPF0748 family)